MRAIIQRLVPIVLLFSVTLTAQLQVCLSVHGVAVGFDNQGAPSRLTAVLVGIPVTIFPGPGMPGPAASAAHEMAFVAAGFVTVRTGPNEFCIVTMPNGLPPAAGAAYGTTDPGLGLDNRIRRAPQQPGQPLVPQLKDHGAGLALPSVAAPPQPTTITITVYVKVRVLGVPVTVCVQVPLLAGLPGSMLQDEIQFQLEQAGFLGHRIVIDDPLQPGQLIDVLQLERTGVGEPIEGVEIQWGPAAQQVLPQVIACGMDAIYGAREYGLSTQGLASRQPYTLLSGLPQVGGAFDVIHETAYANGICANALSLGEAGLPVFHGFLLVDPSGMVLELGLTDPNGSYVRPFLLPPDPTLAGFTLHSQAVVLDPGGQHTFSTGMQVVVYP